MTDTITLPSHLSNSQFTTFSDCGEKWRLRYQTDAPRQPQGALIAGIAIHDTIEAIYREGWWREPYDHQNDITALFADLLHVAVGEAEGTIRWAGRKSNAWPNGEDLGWWEIHGPKLIQRAADVMIEDQKSGNVIWGTDADPLAGIELALTVPIEGLSVPVTGRIDALMVDPFGQPFVRDWTTGKPGGKTPFQGALYAWCVLHADGFGFEVERCEYAYLKGTSPGVILQSFDPRPFMDRVIENFVMMGKALEAGVFMLRPSSFCAGCEVKASCDYGKTL